jgi:hypothetical protein
MFRIVLTRISATAHCWDAADCWHSRGIPLLPRASSQLCPNNGSRTVLLRPGESLVARSVALRPGQTETEWDRLGHSENPLTSLIMLRSLVRFQLAPPANLEANAYLLPGLRPDTLGHHVPRRVDGCCAACDSRHCYRVPRWRQNHIRRLALGALGGLLMPMSTMPHAMHDIARVLRSNGTAELGWAMVGVGGRLHRRSWYLFCGRSAAWRLGCLPTDVVSSRSDLCVPPGART